MSIVTIEWAQGVAVLEGYGVMISCESFLVGRAVRSYGPATCDPAGICVASVIEAACRSLRLLPDTLLTGFAREGYNMPRGDKSKYTDKQKREAEHIEEGYEDRGVGKKEAERRAWATVNKMTHGGKKAGGSGRGKSMDTSPAKKGGKKGGEAAARRPAAARRASARKAATTRARRSTKK